MPVNTQSANRDAITARLAAIDRNDPEYAPQVVDELLAAASQLDVTDVHLQSTGEGLDCRWRVDGVLQHVALLPQEAAVSVIARLKVLADLLTYRTDTPQEGRIRPSGSDLEMRLSTMPTLHGEKAVIRLFAGEGRYRLLEELGLPATIAGQVADLLDATSGALLVTGPAGSGKTTTAYACLRHLAERTAGARSLVSLEDPVEVEIPGVAQSQVKDAAGFDLATGLRYLLRQDPEVILVGEIRDPATARTCFQAALTGHLVLSTFHAGSAAEAVERLLDMNLEPYSIRSGLLAVVSQRLVRRLCACAQRSDAPEARLGFDIDDACLPVGCDACAGTGYRGRFPIAEMLTLAQAEVGRAILARAEAAQLERLAIAQGMHNRWQSARDAVASGHTTAAEIRRVLGLARAAEDRTG